jgi:hypothetical protein
MSTIATSYFAAFLLGLFSTVHCIAMCGSVIGALTLSLPAEIREQPRRMFPYVFNYNVGRILSYAVAGLIVGLLSSPLAQFNAHNVLRVIAVVVMIAMGLYLAGWFPKFAMMERVGVPIWRRLQPIGHRLLPVRSAKQAFLLGMIWGWLPCGLVYAALAVAATTGDPLQSMWVMLSFGAGILPAVMGAGLFTGLLAGLANSKRFRQAAGILIIAMALGSLWIPVGHEHHHHADTHAHHEGMHS